MKKLYTVYITCWIFVWVMQYLNHFVPSTTSLLGKQKEKIGLALQGETKKQTDKLFSLI